MKRKFIDTVNIREVTDKVWYLEENEDIQGFIGFKYIKAMTEPIIYYCNGKKYTELDKGFSMIEYLPKDKGFNCRVVFDDKNRLISLYFDVNNGTGVENGRPWYDDLYLDVFVESPTITGGGFYIRLDDEIEYKKAFAEGAFDEKTFQRGYATAHMLMAELMEKDNEILNRCQYDLIRIKKLLKLM